MVKRHTAVAVMAGAYVFPGGQLGLADGAGDIAALSDGLGGVRDRMEAGHLLRDRDGEGRTPDGASDRTRSVAITKLCRASTREWPNDAILRR